MLTKEAIRASIIEELAAANGAHQAAVINVEAQRIKLRRKVRDARAAGWSLAQIAEVIGVSRQRVEQLSKAESAAGAAGVHAAGWRGAEVGAAVLRARRHRT